MDFAFKSGSNSCTCCSSAILQKGEKVLVKELYLLHCIFKWSTAPCGYCVLLNFDTRNYWNRGCTVTKNIKLWLVLWTDETEFEIFIYSRRQEGTTKILQEKVQHCTVFFSHPLLVSECVCHRWSHKQQRWSPTVPSAGWGCFCRSLRKQNFDKWNKSDQNNLILCLCIRGD